MTRPPITINCDLGESYGRWRLGDDSALMPLIDCANVACGFHAGDPQIIRATLALAAQHRVSIGAHVAYPDLQGFGRRSMAIRGRPLIDLLHYQMSALSGMAQLQGLAVDYVKPHGALYNDMMQDHALLADIMQAVAEWPRAVDLVVLATPNNAAIRDMADARGVKTRFEAFADRGYTDQCTLVPRAEPGALLDATAAARQAKALATDTLLSNSGKPLSLSADTVCIHGDSPDAAALLRAVRSELRP